MKAPYEYPSTNERLIKELKLQSHPEGGFFSENFRQKETVPTPYINGSPQRHLSTLIYYFLSPESPIGYFHRNASTIVHLLHQGRSRYTLISPDGSITKQVTMGEDVTNGETRQLIVEGGWWKASEIPPEDLEAAKNCLESKIGALISEVVVPGFDFDDHAFLTEEVLRKVIKDETKVSELRRLLNPHFADTNGIISHEDRPARPTEK